MTLHAHRRRDRKWASRYIVLFDGVHHPRAYYADGRRGVIREFVTDENGKFIHDCEKGELKKQELRGHVKWRRIR
jgi:hypothetical protein